MDHCSICGRDHKTDDHDEVWGYTPRHRPIGRPTGGGRVPPPSRQPRVTREDVRNEAYIKFLHEPHEWVPGSASVAIEAFEAGWDAALRAFNLKD